MKEYTNPRCTINICQQDSQYLNRNNFKLKKILILNKKIHYKLERFPTLKFFLLIINLHKILIIK